MTPLAPLPPQLTASSADSTSKSHSKAICFHSPGPDTNH